MPFILHIYSSIIHLCISIPSSFFLYIAFQLHHFVLTTIPFPLLFIVSGSHMHFLHTRYHFLFHSFIASFFFIPVPNRRRIQHSRIFISFWEGGNHYTIFALRSSCGRCRHSFSLFTIHVSLSLHLFPVLTG